MKLERTWSVLILLLLLAVCTPMYSAEPDSGQKDSDVAPVSRSEP